MYNVIIDRGILFPAHIVVGIVLAVLGGLIYTKTLSEDGFCLRVVRGTAVALAVLVAVTQSYFLTVRTSDWYNRSVNAFHVVIVAPLLFALGYFGNSAPYYLSGAVAMLGAAAAAYHVLRTVQHRRALANVRIQEGSRTA